MPRGTSRPLRLLPGVLLLGSAVGLLAAVLVWLSSAAEDARARAREETRRATQEEARTLRALLEGEAAFEAAPAGARFAVELGRAVPPDGFTLPAEEPLAALGRLPFAARLLVEHARFLEFAEGDRAGADAALERAAAGHPLAPELAAWIDAQRGFVAMRGGDRASASRHLDAALERSRVSPIADPTLAAAVIHLSLELDRALPDDLDLAVLPDGGLRAAVGAAAAARERSERARAFHAAGTGLLAERARFRRARAALADADPALASAAMAGDALILHRPSGAGEGEIAVLLRDEQPRYWADLGAPDLAARLRAGAAADDAAFAAVPVLPGLALALPAESPARRAGALLAAAVVALLATGALGLLLWLRLLAREARALRERSEFVTAVTHELKTPVAALALCAEMLGDERLPEERRGAYLASIRAEAGRLGLLIENVLGVVPLERGERAYDLRPRDWTACVRDAAADHAPLLERDGILLELDLPAAARELVCDAAALRLVLGNLLENARRYAAAGGRVTVRGSEDADRVTIAVRDRGPGIDPAEREAVFARFARGSAARRGGNPGVGLGLALARRIVEDHGGALAAVDPPDGGPGACLEIVLPRAMEGARRADLHRRG